MGNRNGTEYDTRPGKAHDVCVAIEIHHLATFLKAAAFYQRCMGKHATRIQLCDIGTAVLCN
jgi:hypothetical protein